VIAIVAGIAALWAAVRLDSLRSTVVASLIMGVAVSSMHYTGMAALHVQAAPGLAVSYAATAGAEAFLLPLILGLSSAGFIFSAVISLAPTAAEMVEEAQLMERIGRSVQVQPSALPGRQLRPGRPGQPTESQPAESEPGSLFRPRQPDQRREP
jgi:hypothetical protein